VNASFARVRSGALKKILVALGGNAILRHKEKGTAEEQLENIKRTCRHMVRILKDGYRIAITHGNGPQVGDILLRNEKCRDILPPMPLDVCGADSQGMIGYMLQQSMRNEMHKAGLEFPVVTLVTQVVVDENDMAFKKPTKPIGPFYTALEAERLRREENWTVVDDGMRGYRRVVPSPQPKAIVERDSIKTLFGTGTVVIASGGGGVPVIAREDGGLEGVEAVVDKDLTAELFAREIGAEILLMLTDVGKVAINFGKPGQKDLDDMTVAEAARYLAEGQFPLGSMGPKIEAAMRFIKCGGEKVIVTSLESARQALAGKAGTLIH